MANAMLYVELEESIASDYVSVIKMFHESDLQNQYKQTVEILSSHGVEPPSLEEFKNCYILVDVKYDGRKRYISESDVLKTLEDKGYLKKVGESMFGGFYLKTNKLKVRKEVISGRLLVEA